MSGVAAGIWLKLIASAAGTPPPPSMKLHSGTIINRGVVPKELRCTRPRWATSAAVPFGIMKRVMVASPG